MDNYTESGFRCKKYFAFLKSIKIVRCDAKGSLEKSRK